MHSIECSYVPYLPLLSTPGKGTRIELTMIITLGRIINILSLPHALNYFKKSPLYSILLSWNNLDTIKLKSNRTTFKLGLKEQLHN
jgi:hypothetical protein